VTAVTALVRTRTTVIWIVLILATIASWTLGSDHGISHHALASVVILLIAFIKVRLVGLYFMELRDAPTVLRGLFEAYCLIVCSLLIGVFLVA
jgi:caa(3)-type oxidase subunit IV